MAWHRTRSGIVVQHGGTGGRLLLLLHGLGATGAVWQRMLPLVEESWDGAWAVPDLRGHGRSAAVPPYGYGMHAADMAELCTELAADRVTVLGHSFGGVVAAVLAGGTFGVTVDRVLALGVKIDWTADEVAGARSMAGRPARVLPSREEAAGRHLALAGLRGLAAPGDEVTGPGVREVEGGWTAALDPRVFDAVGPSVETILARSAAPLRLAAGETDPMVSAGAMRRIDADARVLPGVGHNAHWEDPAAVLRLLTATPA